MKKEIQLDEFEIRMTTLQAQGLTSHEIAEKFPKGIHLTPLSLRKQIVTYKYVEKRASELQHRLKAKNKTHLIAILIAKGLISPFKK